MHTDGGTYSCSGQWWLHAEASADDHCITVGYCHYSGPWKPDDDSEQRPALTSRKCWCLNTVAYRSKKLLSNALYSWSMAFVCLQPQKGYFVKLDSNMGPSSWLHVAVSCTALQTLCSTRGMCPARGSKLAADYLVPCPMAS